MLVILAIVLCIKPFLYWQNDTLGITNYTVFSSKIPPAFDGYKIIQLSDIHGKEFGENNQDLINKIEKQNADMLVITGDLVDEGVQNSKEIIDNLLGNTKLPKEVFAVSGNHDLWTKHFDAYKKQWETSYNIEFLENSSTKIQKDGQVINLCGISDPDIWNAEKAEEIVKENLAKIKTTDGYNVLLFHRANMLDMFLDSSFDLILSGHIHGGQIRVPFVGGLRSPHGNWFPKYSGGKYLTGDKTYIVSRGIGNAVVVPRIFNRPEMAVITLKNH